MSSTEFSSLISLPRNPSGVAILVISASSDCEKKYFENVVGKGENADKKHFLFFCHNAFHYIKDKLSHFSPLQNAFNLDEVLLAGKGLIPQCS